MSKTYGVVNLIASLGFTLIWRRVVVSKLTKVEPDVVVDLMTGMGELFRDLRLRFPGTRKVVALDFSANMCRQAREQAKRNPFPTEVVEADVFARSLAANSADIVVSSFGLKTFSEEQQMMLAAEVDRLLKPGGQFSFIEISTPVGWNLRYFYEFYVRCLIPLVGRMCMGNPDNYRQLYVYTKNFGNSRKFHGFLKERGLEAHYFEHFFGCASGVYGSKKTV
jgi:ubiquinone/menaquinone biosynthesis methyltransferase